MARESHIRSILKGFSWRFLATGTLMAIVYFVEGSIETAISIGAIEFIAKLAIYYGHERVWAYFLNGREQTPRISLFKAISWRILASLTTLSIAITALQSSEEAFLVTAIEFFAKFILYYFHERLWQIVPKGTFRGFVKKLLQKK